MKSTDMTSTLRRTWAEIDLDALSYNYHTIRDYIGRDRKFLGVVKADAYGHGSVHIGKKLQELGADYLAVSSIDEAMELRFHGITMPILILGHTPKEQVDRLICFEIKKFFCLEPRASVGAKRTIRRFLPMYMPPSMEVTPSSESTCARVKCHSLYGTAM